jgi:hypothetical protein
MMDLLMPEEDLEGSEEMPIARSMSEMEGWDLLDRTRKVVRVGRGLSLLVPEVAAVAAKMLMLLGLN